jgi:hypothetical protein
MKITVSPPANEEETAAILAALLTRIVPLLKRSTTPPSLWRRVARAEAMGSLTWPPCEDFPS